ncbi:hypothetical protein JYU11_03765, partial [bacterium AH-315-G05]|nr:hypothetical protein [bacterium AH-315-G05]
LVKALGLMNGVEVTILNNMSNIDEKIVKDLLKNKIQLIIMIDMTKNNMQNETALYQEKRVLLDMLKDQVRYYIVVDQELEQTNLAIVEGVDKKRVQYCYTIKNKRQLIENATYKRGLHVTNAQQASMRAKLHPCLTGMLAIDKNMNVLPCLKMKDQVLSKVDFETVNLYRNRKGIEKHWLSPVKRYMKCASCKYNITCMDCKAIESEYSSVYDKVCTRSL